MNGHAGTPFPLRPEGSGIGKASAKQRMGTGGSAASHGSSAAAPRKLNEVVVEPGASTGEEIAPEISRAVRAAGGAIGEISTTERKVSLDI